MVVFKFSLIHVVRVGYFDANVFNLIGYFQRLRYLKEQPPVMRYIDVHVTIKTCVSFPVNSATTTWTVPMAEMNWAVCQPKLMETVSVILSAEL